MRDHKSTSYSLCDFRLSASTGCTIVTKDIIAIPDLVVTISSMKVKLLKYLLIFQCAFSQSVNNLFTKVKRLATSLSDIQMVFLLQIQEHNKFTSPSLTSDAWERFESNPSSLDLPQFLQLTKDKAEESQKSNPSAELPPEEFMGTVHAGAHIWCNISCVQYYVWLRKGDSKLDINPESMGQTEWSAYGELPTQDDGSGMEHVEEIVNKGLAQIRTAIMEMYHNLCEQFQIPVDASLFAMPIVLPTTWNHFCSALTDAKLHCAFNHYQTWYMDTFRGEKHTISNSEFVPSDHEDKETQLEPQQCQHLAEHRPPGKRVAHEGGYNTRSWHTLN
ncbi:hypothetical protein JVT61DRAFT_6249 [Boletus reticuloceps]|uniref:Uncharacterized protein n=1 Tax=Boletus reticuloceps TaxID=495285 RepID=A0A8I3A6K3_9AGAM|nr:hypothetical protein JVT61DRAFT_6249 [Boletus reticuloceps]